MSRYSKISAALTGLDKGEGRVPCRELIFNYPLTDREVRAKISEIKPKNGDLIFVCIKEIEADEGTVSALKSMMENIFEQLNVRAFAIVLNFEVIIKRVSDSAITINFPENLTEREKEIFSAGLRQGMLMTNPPPPVQRPKTFYNPEVAPNPNLSGVSITNGFKMNPFLSDLPDLTSVLSRKLAP